MRSPSLVARLAEIEVLCLDCDGVLTDGTVLVDGDGRESLRFSRRDGHGIALLRQAGIAVVIVTRETCTGPVEARARKLDVPLVRACTDKAAWLRDRHGEHLDRVCFVGDDLPDLEAMRLAGVSAAPLDAVDVVRKAATVKLRARGGRHAVREMADRILAARAAARGGVA